MKIRSNKFLADELPRPLNMTNNSTQDSASRRYLQPELVIVDVSIVNRKRLLEQFAELIATNVTRYAKNHDNHPSIDQIFTSLHNRERLGSTAIGKGIALPHGRIDGLTEPVIAIAKLAAPIGYDSPDGMPIWLAVCLLVPAEANQVHLDLLATLTTKFSDVEFIRAVKESASSAEIYQLFADI